MFLVGKWMRKVPSFHQFTHFNLMLKFCPWKCTQLRCNLVRTGTKPFTLIISIVIYIYASSSVPVAKATIYLNVCFFNLRYTYFHLLHYIGVCVISNMYKSYTYPWPRDSSMFPPSLSSSQTLPYAHVHSWAVFTVNASKKCAFPSVIITVLQPSLNPILSVFPSNQSCSTYPFNVPPSTHHKFRNTHTRTVQFHSI